MARPGIMLYFDILEPIRVLPDADKGRLLVAMLEYGKDGTVPDFNGMLALAWGFVRPKIDKDSEEYNRTILKRQYATFCRDRKRKGEPDVSFEDWLMTIDDQSDHMISHDITWYPTTSTTTTTNTSATTSTTTTTDTNTTEQEAVAAVFTAFLEKINPTPSATCIEELKAFAGQMGSECCIRAMDIALDAKIANWPYIRGILRTKLQQGVKCIADWDEIEAKREETPVPTEDAPTGAQELEEMRRFLASMRSREDR